MVVFRESACIRAKVVVFGQKWLYSGLQIVFVQNRFYSGKVVVFRESGCIRAKVVVFGQRWLYSGKVVVFGEKWMCSGK